MNTGAALSGEAAEIANDAASVAADRPEKNFFKIASVLGLSAWIPQTEESGNWFLSTLTVQLRDAMAASGAGKSRRKRACASVSSHDLIRKVCDFAGSSSWRGPDY
jgi:hypothetical protein